MGLYDADHPGGTGAGASGSEAEAGDHDAGAATDGRVTDGGDAGPPRSIEPEGDPSKPTDLAGRFSDIAGDVAPRFRSDEVIDIREPAAGERESSAAMPHWTEPATGEVPAALGSDQDAGEAI